MTATRELMLNLTNVETTLQAQEWSRDLDAAYNAGLISSKAYELLQGELQIHLRFENIEFNTVNQ